MVLFKLRLILLLVMTIGQVNGESYGENGPGPGMSQTDCTAAANADLGECQLQKPLDSSELKQEELSSVFMQFNRRKEHLVNVEDLHEDLNQEDSNKAYKIYGKVLIEGKECANHMTRLGIVRGSDSEIVQKCAQKAASIQKPWFSLRTSGRDRGRCHAILNPSSDSCTQRSASAIIGRAGVEGHFFVDEVSKTSGSLAGEQQLVIKGMNLWHEGFRNMDNMKPPIAVCAARQVCDIDYVRSSADQLFCTTRPVDSSTDSDYNVTDEGLRRQLSFTADLCTSGVSRARKEYLHIFKVEARGYTGGDVTKEWNLLGECRSNNAACRYMPSVESSPTVEAVVPQFASPGQEISVSGNVCSENFLINDGQVFLHDENHGDEPFLCDTSGLLDSVRLQRPAQDANDCPKGVFKCRLPSDLPLGNFMVSFTNSFGASISRPLLSDSSMGENLLLNQQASGNCESTSFLTDGQYQPMKSSSDRFAYRDIYSSCGGESDRGVEIATTKTAVVGIVKVFIRCDSDRAIQRAVGIRVYAFDASRLDWEPCGLPVELSELTCHNWHSEMNYWKRTCNVEATKIRLKCEGHNCRQEGYIQSPEIEAYTISAEAVPMQLVVRPAVSAVTIQEGALELSGQGTPHLDPSQLHINTQTCLDTSVDYLSDTFKCNLSPIGDSAPVTAGTRGILRKTWTWSRDEAWGPAEKQEWHICANYSETCKCSGVVRFGKPGFWTWTKVSEATIFEEPERVGLQCRDDWLGKPNIPIVEDSHCECLPYKNLLEGTSISELEARTRPSKVEVGKYFGPPPSQEYTDEHLAGKDAWAERYTAMFKPARTTRIVIYSHESKDNAEVSVWRGTVGGDLLYKISSNKDSRPVATGWLEAGETYEVRLDRLYIGGRQGTYVTTPIVRTGTDGKMLIGLEAKVDNDCNETLTGIGSDYRGCQSTTRSGKTCQSWDVQSPNSHVETPATHPNAGLAGNNHCRNPTGNPEGIWCYTNTEGLPWEFCDSLDAPSGDGSNAYINDEFFTLPLLPGTAPLIGDYSCSNFDTRCSIMKQTPASFLQGGKEQSLQLPQLAKRQFVKKPPPHLPARRWYSAKSRGAEMTAEQVESLRRRVIGRAGTYSHEEAKVLLATSSQIRKAHSTPRTITAVVSNQECSKKIPCDASTTVDVQRGMKYSIDVEAVATDFQDFIPTITVDGSHSGACDPTDDQTARYCESMTKCLRSITATDLMTADGKLTLGVVQSVSGEPCKCSNRTFSCGPRGQANYSIFAVFRLTPVEDTSDSSVHYWSDRQTWGGDEIPTGSNTDIVYIPDGKTLVLDMDVHIRFWIVEGTLKFAEKDVHLQAESIVVNGGNFYIGSEEHPFTHKARITLHGHWHTFKLPIFGIKNIALTFGNIGFYGMPKTSWTELARTANRGASEIEVKSATNWAVGDRIVIATTDSPDKNCKFNRGDHCQTEEREIVEINGAILKLDSPLRYRHVSESYELADDISESVSWETKPMETRAEVGLLTRNIVIKGTSPDDGGEPGSEAYGAHVMMLRPSSAVFEYVELTYVGQAFQMGRYPIHFHHAGDQPLSRVKGCSIHASHNRALTNHGTNGLVIEDNVAYNIQGHAYFFEDGVEQNSHYTRNLGILVRMATSLLNTDQTPAVFWITHPSNYFEGNHAVGGQDFGFWFDLPERGMGISRFRSGISPKVSPLLLFLDNVAHSNGDRGLWVEGLNSMGAGKRIVATFNRTTTWGNGNAGQEFDRVGHIQVVRSVSISEHAGIGIVRAGADQWASSNNNYQGIRITESIVKSRSALPGYLFSKCGIDGPMNDFQVMDRNIFIDRFQYGAVCGCKWCPKGAGGLEVRASQNLWSQGAGSNRVFFRREMDTNFYDADGTLSGAGERCSEHGCWMHSLIDGNLGYFPPAQCSVESGGFILCDGSIQLRTIRWQDPEPLTVLNRMPLSIKTEHGSTTRNHYRYDIYKSNAFHHHFTMVTGLEHTIGYVAPPQLMTDLTLFGSKVEVCGMLEDDKVVLNFETLTNPFGWAVNGIRRPLAEMETCPSWCQQYKCKDYLCTSQHCGSNWKCVNRKHKDRAEMVDCTMCSALIDEGSQNKPLWDVTGNHTHGIWSYTKAHDTFDHSNYTPGKMQILLSGKDTRVWGTWDGKTKEKPACNQHCGAGQPSLSLHLERLDTDPDRDLLGAGPTGPENINCISGDEIYVGDDSQIAEARQARRIEWCNNRDWPNLAVPSIESTVAIYHNWTVLLGRGNCIEAKVRRLDIFGTLKFYDQGARSAGVTLYATYIHVNPGGLFEIGTELYPFRATARIIMQGTKQEPQYEGSGLGSKFISVMGNISIVARRNLLWTKLRLTAPKNSRTLFLDDSRLSLERGDKLAIGPTGYDPNQAEQVTVVSARRDAGGGLRVDLDAPLQHEHTGLNYDFLGKSGVMAAEVGQLTSNVIIEGEDTSENDYHENFGVSIHVEQSGGNCYGLGGTAQISGLELRFCGQRPTHGCLNLIGARSGSYVRQSSIHSGFATGLKLEGGHHCSIAEEELGICQPAEPLLVEDNVVYDVKGNGFLIKGSRHHMVVRNLVVLVRDLLHDTGHYTVRACATPRFTLDCPCVGYEVSGDPTFQNNVLAGSELVGMMLPLESCDQQKIRGNIIHSTNYGLYGIGGYGACKSISDFTIWKTISMGFHSRVGGIVKVLNSLFLDTHIAASHLSGGPDPFKHVNSAPNLHFAVSNTSIYGNPMSCEQYGVVGGKWFMCALSFMACRQQKNGPSLYGRTDISDVKFVGFKAAAGARDIHGGRCSGTRHAAVANDGPKFKPLWESSDAAHSPIRVRNLQFDQSEESNRLYFLPSETKIGWGTRKCAQMHCDGRRSSTLIDEDGSLMGQAGTVVAKNEQSFSDGLIPYAQRFGSNGGSIPSSQLYSAKGIYREGCTWIPGWRAYKCPGGQQRQLIVEVLDHAAEHRRFAPVTMEVNSELHSPRGGTMSQFTGPQETAHQIRLSTFWMVGNIGMQHHVFFTSSPPDNLRIHLREVTRDEGLILSVYWGVPNRVNAYVKGRRIAPYREPTWDLCADRNGGVQECCKSLDIDMPHGSNIYDRLGVCPASGGRPGFMHAVVKGSQPLDFRLTQKIKLTGRIEVVETEFFQTGGASGLVRNIALLLGIPESRVAVVGSGFMENGTIWNSNTSVMLQRLSSLKRDVRENEEVVVNVIIDDNVEEEISLFGATNMDEDAFALDTEHKKSETKYRESMKDAIPNGQVVDQDSKFQILDATMDRNDEVLGWSCEPNRYNSGDGCDCDCGIWDPDCDSVAFEPRVGWWDHDKMEFTIADPESVKLLFEVYDKDSNNEIDGRELRMVSSEHPGTDIELLAINLAHQSRKDVNIQVATGAGICNDDVGVSMGCAKSDFDHIHDELKRGICVVLPSTTAQTTTPSPPTVTPTRHDCSSCVNTSTMDYTCSPSRGCEAVNWALQDGVTFGDGEIHLAGEVNIAKVSIPNALDGLEVSIGDATASNCWTKREDIIIKDVTTKYRRVPYALDKAKKLCLDYSECIGITCQVNVDPPQCYLKGRYRKDAKYTTYLKTDFSANCEGNGCFEMHEGIRIVTLTRQLGGRARTQDRSEAGCLWSPQCIGYSCSRGRCIAGGQYDPGSRVRGSWDSYVKNLACGTDGTPAGGSTVCGTTSGNSADVSCTPSLAANYVKITGPTEGIDMREVEVFGHHA